MSVRDRSQARPHSILSELHDTSVVMGHFSCLVMNHALSLSSRLDVNSRLGQITGASHEEYGHDLKAAGSHKRRGGHGLKAAGSHKQRGVSLTRPRGGS